MNYFVFASWMAIIRQPMMAVEAMIVSTLGPKNPIAVTNTAATASTFRNSVFIRSPKFLDSSKLL